MELSGVRVAVIATWIPPSLAHGANVRAAGLRWRRISHENGDARRVALQMVVEASERLVRPLANAMQERPEGRQVRQLGRPIEVAPDSTNLLCTRGGEVGTALTRVAHAN